MNRFAPRTDWARHPRDRPKHKPSFGELFQAARLKDLGMLIYYDPDSPEWKIQEQINAARSQALDRQGYGKP